MGKQGYTRLLGKAPPDAWRGSIPPRRPPPIADFFLEMKPLMTIQWPESQAKGQRLDDSESAKLRELERQYGEQKLAQMIGIGREGVIRACANCGQYPANLTLIRRFLATHT